MTPPLPAAMDPAPSDLPPVDLPATLTRDLARADAARRGAGAVLRHLLAHDDGALFGEEVIARVRGTIADVVRQLDDLRGDGAGEGAALAATLAQSAAFLGHAHALALEWRATSRLTAAVGVPPVLSPLVQALVASETAATADAAMRFLAAQARFARNQARMELPLGELPAEILHAALAAVPERDRAIVTAAVARRYDEGATRLALAGQLVVAMGAGAVAALAPDHAGYALFASALATTTGLARDAALLALQDPDGVSAAVMLRAGHQTLPAIAAALALLHPDAPVPPLEGMTAEAAAALLAGQAGPTP